MSFFNYGAKYNKQNIIIPYPEVLDGNANIDTNYVRQPFVSEDSSTIIPFMVVYRFIGDEKNSELVLIDNIPDRLNELCRLAKAQVPSRREDFLDNRCKVEARVLLTQQLMVDWGPIFRALIVAGIIHSSKL